MGAGGGGRGVRGKVTESFVSSVPEIISPTN